MFFHIRKACHQRRPAGFHSLLHTRGGDFRVHTMDNTSHSSHKTKSRVEQETAEDIGSCTATLILLGDQLFRWLRQWRRPQGAAVDRHHTTQSAAVPHKSCDSLVRDSTNAACRNLINVLLLLYCSVVPGVGPCSQAYLTHECHRWIHCSPCSSPARGSTRLHSWPRGLQRSILSSGPVTRHCATTTSLAAHLTLSQASHETNPDLANPKPSYCGCQKQENL